MLRIRRITNDAGNAFTVNHDARLGRDLPCWRNGVGTSEFGDRRRPRRSDLFSRRHRSVDLEVFVSPSESRRWARSRRSLWPIAAFQSPWAATGTCITGSPMRTEKSRPTVMCVGGAKAAAVAIRYPGMRFKERAAGGLPGAALLGLGTLAGAWAVMQARRRGEQGIR